MITIKSLKDYVNILKRLCVSFQRFSGTGSDSFSQQERHFFFCSRSWCKCRGKAVFIIHNQCLVSMCPILGNIVQSYFQSLQYLQPLRESLKHTQFTPEMDVLLINIPSGYAYLNYRLSINNNRVIPEMTKLYASDIFLLPKITQMIIVIITDSRNIGAAEFK